MIALITRTDVIPITQTQKQTVIEAIQIGQETLIINGNLVDLRGATTTEDPKAIERAILKRDRSWKCDFGRPHRNATRCDCGGQPPIDLLEANGFPPCPELTLPFRENRQTNNDPPDWKGKHPTKDGFVDIYVHMQKVSPSIFNKLMAGKREKDPEQYKKIQAKLKPKTPDTKPGGGK